MAESESEHELIDEGELEKMEWEVREMAKKITEYRKTLPDNLRNTLDSALSSSHSFFPSIASGSDPLPSSSERLTVAPGSSALFLQFFYFLQNQILNITHFICERTMSESDSLIIMSFGSRTASGWKN